MDNELIGKLGVIDDAHSPYHGEIVEVISVQEDGMLVVKLHDPNNVKALPFYRATLMRSDVRIL